MNRTRLDDVRKTGGVSGSQLSHYFDGKRDLTRQVVALRARDVLEFRAHPEPGQFDSLESLRNWACHHLSQVETQYLRGGCSYGSLVGDLLESDEAVLDELAAGYDRWLRTLQAGPAAMRLLVTWLPAPIPATWRQLCLSPIKAARCSHASSVQASHFDWPSTPRSITSHRSVHRIDLRCTGR